MREYSKSDAREWARSNMVGVCGCLLPTFTTDLRSLNEQAIVHDLRREKELGFWGTLLVSECGTTLAEMCQIIDIAAKEATQLGLHTILLGSFSTVDDLIEMSRYAEHAGVDVVMVSYPPWFYPETEDALYQYTKHVADNTDMGVMLFAIDHWNLGRLHPSGFSPRVIARLVEDVPSVVAIKDEIGGPGVGGIAEIFRRFNSRVVVTDPLEQNAPAWSHAFDMQFLGTSNYEYMGNQVVRYFELLREKSFDDAMEIYWRLHPARQANGRLMTESMAGTSLVHRQLWKYEYWLNGFNGGPLRPPHMRITDEQMRTLRSALVASGIEPTSEPDSAFFVGRNPC